MALDYLEGYGYVDDGVLHIVNKKNNGTISPTEVKEIVKEVLAEEGALSSSEIEEKNDVLYVGGKPVMKDDYITGGTYNEGTVTLTNSNGTETTVTDLPNPKALDKEDIEELFDKE